MTKPGATGTVLTFRSPLGGEHAPQFQSATGSAVSARGAVRGSGRSPRRDASIETPTSRSSPLTLPAARRAMRAGREALSLKGRGKNRPGCDCARDEGGYNGHDE